MRTPPRNRIYQFAGFILDVNERRLERDGQEIYLQPKTFDTLQYLVERHGSLVKKNEMMDTLWADSFVTDNALTRCIKEVREALADDAYEPRFIKTIPRVGFKFIADVDAIASLEPRGTAATKIAVLPFKPLVPADREESLEMGMADTLITRLSGLTQIVVRPISVVRRYVDLEQDPVSAGREQQVDVVLDGNIQTSGNRIRVTARLVKVADGTPLWTGQFDEKTGDIFAVQDSISDKVVAALKMRLTGDERALITKRYTNNPEAYQRYMKGRHFWNQWNPKAGAKAIEYFLQAVEIDPNYALAYAGGALTYVSLADLGAASHEMYSEAKAWAQRAIEIDDDLADAHAALATLNMNYYWDWPKAEHHFKRAIELNPNNADSHYGYGLYLRWVARFDDAIAAAKRAVSLAPSSFPFNLDLGLTLVAAKRYDEAFEQLQKTIEMYPNHSYGYFALAFTYLYKAQYVEAISTLKTARSLADDFLDAVALQAFAYAKAGKRGEALNCLDELQAHKTTYVPPFLLAVVYLGLDDKEKVFEYLEKAYEDRNWHLIMLKVDPNFDPLRSDPRFSDLLGRVGQLRSSRLRRQKDHLRQAGSRSTSGDDDA